jgi:hypothetical protein
LFPNAKVFPVLLDQTDPLRDGPTAYQTLDAIIIDDPWPGGLRVAALPDLLAGGTVVAVRTRERPDSVLPWEPLADGWVLRPHLAGPMGCDGDESGYAPASSWHPDWPARLRQQVLFAGVLFSLAAGACLLLRGRRAVAALIAISILTSAVVLVWHRHHPAVFEATGSIIVDAPPWLQRDLWTYITAAEPATARIACDGITWPIFADPSQSLRLHVSWRRGRGSRSCTEAYVHCAGTTCPVARHWKPP